ncbi:hypothetical protein [Burkholderia cepacia]|uniref:hypothetical protein n=1 Tax=Burkholderia cepacia TaxID=292 RepID=UPI001E535327|nr:hypothetical protein [Burkholderia cepacia]
MITPPHRLTLNCVTCHQARKNMAAPWVARMKRGFLFSIKRNQSQVTRCGRKPAWPGARRGLARSPASTAAVHRPTVRGVTRRTIFFPAWRATIGV